LLAATWIAVVCSRRGKELFARPTRSFVIGLTALLWVVSFTHMKAIFPVGLATLAMFSLQMMLFRAPRLRFGLIAAWISASFGLTPFLTQVLHWNLSPETFLWVMTGSAALLLLPDRFLGTRKLEESDQQNLPSPYAIGDPSSLLLTLVLSLVWMGFWTRSPVAETPWSSGLLLVVLMLGHSLRWCLPGLSLLSLLFAGLYAVLMAHAAGIAAPIIISFSLIVAGGLWLASVGLKRIPETRISRAFGEASQFLGGWASALGLFAFTMLAFARTMAGSPMELWWSSTLVPVAWAFDAARRWRSEVWTGLGCFGVLGFAGAIAVTLFGRDTGWEWMPLVWSAVGLVALPIVPRPFRWMGHHAEETPPEKRYITGPLGQFLTVLFVLLAVGMLPVFSIPARLASLASLAGLFWLAGDWQNAWLRHLGLSLLNWHVLSGVIQVLVPDARHLLDLNREALLAVSLPLALVAAVSRLCWNLSSRSAGSGLAEWVSFHRLMLLGVACFGLVWSLHSLSAGLVAVQVLLAAGVFLALAADQIWQALKSQDEAHVWAAEGISLAAVGYLVLFDVIRFGSGLSMYAVLVTGWTAWIIGHLASSRGKWNVLSDPLLLTGYALPAVTVILGIVRHFTVPHSLWLGMNSLALLFAAGFYFWRGIEEKQKTWMLSAAAILNVALALLWRELAWTDPQLFAIPLGISILALVQWLKDEIPAQAHDPLRYLGALVILVSPVFHIVGGSWWHLLTLMIASVAVTLTAMGLKIRALMYTGTGFLLGDLIAMVVRGSIDNPTLLWIAGILVGLAVISLAAYCEKHREEVLQRLRLMAAKLETWE
jgi:hypothetical protein